MSFFVSWCEFGLFLCFLDTCSSFKEGIPDGLGGNRLGKKGIDVSGHFSRVFDSTSGDLFDDSMFICGRELFRAASWMVLLV